MEKSINQKLEELYDSKWKNFSNALINIINDENYDIKPTNPLLLKHKDCNEYESSEIRVMILGQETNDWGYYEDGCFSDEIEMEKILDMYVDFYSGYKFEKHRGFFKNHFNNFLKLLKEKYPEKKTSCFWNNVIKVGKANDKNTPPEYILKLEQEHFSVLKKEIEIIKPNVILFYSGYSYDKYILHHFPELITEDIKGFTSIELQTFKIENVDFAFRTAHPQSLHFNGKERYKMIYDKIISEISF